VISSSCGQIFLPCGEKLFRATTFRFVRRFFDSGRQTFCLCEPFSGLCAEKMVCAGHFCVCGSVFCPCAAIFRLVPAFFEPVRRFSRLCGDFSICAKKNRYFRIFARLTNCRLRPLFAIGCGSEIILLDSRNEEVLLLRKGISR
jgi:hypothetical protein